MLKSMSDTRWSARSDALLALVTSHKEIKAALEDLIKDKTQTPDTRLTAEGFVKTLENFQTVLLIVIWNDILQRVDKVSKTLQTEELDLLGATKELESLSLFLNEKSEKFDDFEAEALKMANLSTPSYDRARKRTMFFDEQRDEQFEKMDPRTRYRTGVFKPIFDHLVVQLSSRKNSYENLSKRFEIFSQLHEKKYEDLVEQAKKVAQYYSNDICENDFVQECHHFQMYMKAEKLKRIRDCYSYIKENSLTSTFPNLEVAIRVYLTLPVTNCSAERSFSALKKIKSENRSTIADEKLNSLMLLCTQSDITLKLDCDKLISTFSNLKMRKKPM